MNWRLSDKALIETLTLLIARGTGYQPVARRVLARIEGVK